MATNQADDWQDLPPAKSAQNNNDDWQDLPPSSGLERFSGMANKALDTVGQGAVNLAMPVVKAAGKAADFVDRYTGAPVRAAVNSAISPDNNGDSPLEAFKKQFGESTANAPTGKDIAQHLGFSADPSIQTGLYTSPTSKLSLSPAGIAGAGLDTVTNPLNYIPGKAFEYPIEVGLKGLGYAAKLAEPALELGTEYGSKAAGKLLAGMPGDYIERYLENPSAIKNALPIEDLKTGIDQSVNQVQSEASDLASKTKAQKDLLDEFYEQKRQELKGQTTPLNEARDIRASLIPGKQKIGELSQKADDVLANSGVNFKRDDLIQAVNKVGSDLGDFVIGDQQKQAVGKLQDIKNRLLDTPENLTAPQVREIMSQIGQDADYEQSTQPYDSVSNKALKQLRFMASSALKNSNPEYAKIMDEMKPLNDSISNMYKYFGTDEKALQSLEALRKGGSAKTNVIEDALKTYAEQTGNQDILAKANNLKGSKELYDRMGKEDLRKELFPSEYSNLNDLMSSQQMADTAINGQGTDLGIKKLTPQSTQSIIKNVGGKNPSIENVNALKNLGQLTDQDYLQNIKDTGLQNQLTVDQTRGSLFPLMGGAVGAKIGYGLGGPHGALTGAMMGATGGAALGRSAGKAVELGMDAGKWASGAAGKIASKFDQFSPQVQSILTSAAKRGSQGLLVTNYILMNNDPAYRQIMTSP